MGNESICSFFIFKGKSNKIVHTTTTTTTTNNKK